MLNEMQLREIIAESGKTRASDIKQRLRHRRQSQLPPSKELTRIVKEMAAQTQQDR